MKKVLIHAYTTFNFGDDLFITMLINRYPETQFLLYAPNKYSKVFSQHKNITIIPSNTYHAKVLNWISRHVSFIPYPEQKLAQNCDAVVQIGGSLFMETDHWPLEWKKTVALRKASSKFFLLGANFGPFQHDHFYSHYRQLFKHFTDICFRDQHSYTLFSDMQHVRVAPDIVFAMDHPVSVNLKQTAPKQRRVVLSIIKPSIRKHLVAFDHIYREKMTEIAIFFMNTGYEVIFTALCTYEGDKEMMNAITDSIPKIHTSAFSCYTHKNSVAETCALFQSAALIIASRFHAMIMGWTLHKVVFPIIYSQKMRHAMCDIGYEGESCDFENLHSLQPEDILEEMTKSPMDIHQQKANALRHFAVLDQLLDTSICLENE